MDMKVLNASQYYNNIITDSIHRVYCNNYIKGEGIILPFTNLTVNKIAFKRTRILLEMFYLNCSGKFAKVNNEDDFSKLIGVFCELVTFFVLGTS